MSTPVQNPSSESQSESPSESHTAELALEDISLPVLGVRGAIGGVMMGLANLVPGISGGTMLLAAGVYPAFISAIAELSTLRLRVRTIYLVGVIAGAAALAILLLAGLMRSLVLEQRWLMYSLFIGLTLGGVPLVWRLARPATKAVAVSAVAAFGLMIVMQLGLGEVGGDGRSVVLLLLSGLAGASAMILPGVSGGYLLLLLGQYEEILGAIDQMKNALLHEAGPQLSGLMGAMEVVVPVGIGVVVGVVGVSNLLKWLLARYEKATLGALLGLLFGAVVGLWPFQQPVEPTVGDVVEGRVLDAEALAALEPGDWPTERYAPGAGRAAAALGLVGLGLAATLVIDHIGRDDRDEAASG